MITDNATTIKKPNGLEPKGTLTFIPHNPPIIVGIDIIIVIAAKNPNVNEIKYEISDFLYHMMVLMVEKNVTWDEIMTELSNR